MSSASDGSGNSSHPVQPLDYESKKQSIWTVGTLVYTLSGLALLFTWLLWGDFALSLRDRSVGGLVEKFLLKNGTGNVLKQLLTSTLPTTIGLILGPTISYLSDRTRGPRGRRIPYLLLPTPIAGLAMVGIAFSPQMGQWLYTVTGHTPAAGQTLYEASSIYTMSVFTVLWTIFEVAVITSGSVFGGLLNDVVPRSVLGRFHGLFRAVSLFDGILFKSLLFQHAEQHFTLMFAMIGLVFGGGFMLMCLKVKEGNYPPPPPEEEYFPVGSALSRCVNGGVIVGMIIGVYSSLIYTTIAYSRILDAFNLQHLMIVTIITVGSIIISTVIGFAVGEAVNRRGKGNFFWWMLAFIYRFFSLAMGYARECFTQPYYLLCFIMFCLSGLTFRPINEFSYRYAMQLKMEDSDYGFIDSSSYLISLILAFPLGMLVDKFHPLRMSLLSLFLYILTMIYAVVYAHGAMTFGIALIAHTILSGTYFTCSASLGQQLLPRSKFTQYSSAGGIIGSLVGLVYAPTIGAILDFSKTETTVSGVISKDYNYHLTFWGGLIIATLTIITMIMVYQKFKTYGGLKGYLAPGDTGTARTIHEPPKHMFQILSVYFIGATIGLIVGYFLSYLVVTICISHGLIEASGLTLRNFPSYIFDVKNIRNTTTFCLAAGVLPFLISGGWIGSQWARRKTSADGATSH